MFNHWLIQNYRLGTFRIMVNRGPEYLEAHPFICIDFAPTDLSSAVTAVKRLLPVLVSEWRRRPRRGRPVVEPGRRRTRLERPRRHVPGVGKIESVDLIFNFFYESTTRVDLY